MNEWVQTGKDILQARQDLSPQERSAMEAHVKAAELSSDQLAQMSSIGLQNSEAAQKSVVQEPAQIDIPPLSIAVSEYQNRSHTLELVTQIQKAIWKARGEFAGATYEVTPAHIRRKN